MHSNLAKRTTMVKEESSLPAWEQPVDVQAAQRDRSDCLDANGLSQDIQPI
jgi:hypothetical protein